MTIAYMIGISWYVTPLPYIIFLHIITIACAVCFTNLYHHFILALGMIFFCLLGMLRIATTVENHSQFLTSITDKKFDAIAKVVDISAHEHPLYKQKITLEIVKIKQSALNYDPWIHQNFTIQLYTKRQDKLSVADTIFIASLPFKNIKNEGFLWYLIKEGISATIFMDTVEMQILHRPLYSLERGIFNLRERIINSLQKKINRRTFQLFASIFLGNKPAPKDQLEQSKDHFNTWGVMHYLARSGLHMVIFIFIWQLLLNMVPIPFFSKQIGLILLTILYCLLSWSSISFIRAVLSFFLYRLCLLARIQTNFLHILTVVCFMVLLHNPLQLFFLDFQLSFGLTFALALFAQIQTAAAYNY